MDEHTITTLLVEDHEITRLGMKTLLHQMKEIDIVGEAASGTTAVSTAQELHPDLVLMDIGLPGMDGIEATRIIKQSLNSKVVMLTSHDNVDDILAGLSAGADAYCLKTITSSQLATAIHSVMDGAVWLDPKIAKQVVNLITTGAKQSSAPPERTSPANNPFKLSEREYKVLCLLVEGKSNQQMADALYLSTETVKTHMRHLMEKLSVSDRTQAAVKAIRSGIVPAAEQVDDHSLGTD
jgi:DNA-binding NarL/FixJ family response regulator